MNFKNNIIIIGITLVSIFSTYNANSQVLISLLLGDKLNSGKLEFGLTGGLSMTNLLEQPDSKHLNSLFLGFYFDVLLKPETNWYLYTGVLVKSKMGASDLPVYSLGNAEMDSVFQSGRVDRKISYFNVPIELKYKFENNIFIDGGIQAGLRHKASDNFINTVEKSDDLTFQNDIKDDIKRLDFGFSGGAGYKFKAGWLASIGVRYYYGMVNIYKDDNMKGKNSSLYVYMNIPIGAGKKKEAKQ